MSEITLFVPNQVDFDLIKKELKGIGIKKLNPKIKHIKAFFHYLITSIPTNLFRKRKQGKISDKWIPIHSKTLKILLGDYYKKFLEILKKLGYIVAKPFERKGIWYDLFITGKVPKQYMIPKYKGYHYEQCNDDEIIKKLKQARYRAISGNSNHLFIAECVDKLQLEETEESIEFIQKWFEDKYPIFLKNHTALDYIKIFNFGSLPVYTCSYGKRVHHKASYFLPSVFKRVLIIKDDSNQIGGLDIVNSQPWLFASITPDLIGKYVPECKDAIPIILEYQNNSDYIKYQKLCIGGNIYEELVKIFNDSFDLNLEVDRDSAKKALFAGYFSDYDRNELNIMKYGIDTDNVKIKNKKGKHSSEFKRLAYRVFKESFTSLYSMFYKIKKLDWKEINPSKSYEYSNNCLLAQRAESSIFYSNEGIVSELRKVGIDFVVTIHDSVIVKQNDLKLAEKVMKITIEHNLKLSLPKIKKEYY